MQDGGEKKGYREQRLEAMFNLEGEDFEGLSESSKKVFEAVSKYKTDMLRQLLKTVILELPAGRIFSILELRKIITFSITHAGVSKGLRDLTQFSTLEQTNYYGQFILGKEFDNELRALGIIDYKFNYHNLSPELQVKIKALDTKYRITLMLIIDEMGGRVFTLDDLKALVQDSILSDVDNSVRVYLIRHLKYLNRNGLIKLVGKHHTKLYILDEKLYIALKNRGVVTTKVNYHELSPESKKAFKNLRNKQRKLLEEMILSKQLQYLPIFNIEEVLKFSKATKSVHSVAHSLGDMIKEEALLKIGYAKYVFSERLDKDLRAQGIVKSNFKYYELSEESKNVLRKLNFAAIRVLFKTINEVPWFVIGSKDVKIFLGFKYVNTGRHYLNKLIKAGAVELISKRKYVSCVISKTLADDFKKMGIVSEPLLYYDLTPKTQKLLKEITMGRHHYLEKLTKFGKSSFRASDARKKMMISSSATDAILKELRAFLKKKSKGWYAFDRDFIKDVLRLKTSVALGIIPDDLERLLKHQNEKTLEKTKEAKMEFNEQTLILSKEELTRLRLDLTKFPYFYPYLLKEKFEEIERYATLQPLLVYTILTAFKERWIYNSGKVVKRYFVSERWEKLKQQLEEELDKRKN